MHHTDKYSPHSSIIWAVWLNDWVFVYKLSCYGFESPYSHLNNIGFVVHEEIQKNVLILTRISTTR